MLSLDQLRKASPSLTVSDSELVEIRDLLYALGELALESWMEEKEMFPTSHLVTRQES
jgi:hypothetical protein